MIWAVLILLVVSGFAIWFLAKVSRERGKAETEADLNKRMVENAEATGNIIAEHREPGDASKRLRDGTF
jgi:heme/copper-type cytochrome/quinol oxidase subunit 2